MMETENFTEVVDTSFVGVFDGGIAFTDVDGDNDMDVLITGRTRDSPSRLITKLYMNDGNGIFTESTENTFEGFGFADIAFGDPDGDGDLDVLIIGDAGSPSSRTTKFYSNNGAGIFTEVTDTPFVNSGSRGAVAFFNKDGDNDLDVIITGAERGAGRRTSLYTNDGSGVFTLVDQPTIERFSNNALTIADVDYDNDLDVLLSGRDASNNVVSKLFVNNGSGRFSRRRGLPFAGVDNGD